MSAPSPVQFTLVTSYFHPDFSATGQLLTELAVGLRRMGCRVSVCTTHPTYGTRRSAPHFEVYEGVEIRRVVSTRLDKNHRPGRILNSATFFLSAFWTLLVSPARGSLLIVSHPPFLGLLGYILKALKGWRYVYLVHDVYPDIAVTLGHISPDGVTRKIWDGVNRLMLRHASRVVVLGEAMKSVVLKKAGDIPMDADRVRVIHNWVDDEFIRPLPKSDNWFAKKHGLEDQFVVLYAGNMGLSHDLETVIAAAERLQDRKMVFLFIGEGGKKRKLVALAEERGLRNVRFLPYQPREVLPFSATCGDVALVALEKGIEGLSMPSKLYTILASGLPAVALVESGFEVARIIEDAGCGRSVDPSDADGLARVLAFYYSSRDACVHDGRRGRQYFEAHFTRARACREYFDVLESLHRVGEA